MTRCYIPNFILSQKETVLFDKDEIHHLINVLRFKLNDDVFVFNGKGLQASATIISASSHKVTFRINSLEEVRQQHPLLVLACAIPKRSKFETIIEKCTELGIDEIIPLKTARTEVSKASEALARCHRRYEEVAINACKQSQRAFLPKVHSVMTFTQGLDLISKDDLALFGALQAPSQKLPEITSDLLRSKERIVVLIGPEGDFTQEETQLALNRGAIPVTLGPNVLKVETAAIAAIAFLSLRLRS